MRNALERLFRLEERQTSIKVEVGSGLTTFLTMVYILFVNGIVLSFIGMPADGVFIATSLTAFVCTLAMGVFADLPFAVAPTMSANSLFVSGICLGMGYHWREALAIAFIAGLLHVALMATPARRAIGSAIPEPIGVAIGAGLGLFIAFIAVKNTGLFASVATDTTGIAAIIASSQGAQPSAQLFGTLNSNWYICVIAMVIMLGLLALEKRTGLKYGALPISVIATTFLTLPFRTAGLNLPTGSSAPAFTEFQTVFLGFFGSPGLDTIFLGATKTINSMLLIIIFAMTNILDSVGTIIAFRQMRTANLFDLQERDRIKTENKIPRIGRGMIAQAIGGVVAALFGTPTASIYLESTTGIIYGGRTGLTAIVISVLFLVCIPFANFFRIIPIEAVVPAMIFAGGSMMARVNTINWRNIEEGLPAFLIILLVPITGSILDGVCIGFLAHIVLSIFMGKAKKIHPWLYIISAAYIFTRAAGLLLQ